MKLISILIIYIVISITITANINIICLNLYPEYIFKFLLLNKKRKRRTKGTPPLNYDEFSIITDISTYNSKTGLFVYLYLKLKILNKLNFW